MLSRALHRHRHRHRTNHSEPSTSGDGTDRPSISSARREEAIRTAPGPSGHRIRHQPITSARCRPTDRIGTDRPTVCIGRTGNHKRNDDHGILWTRADGILWARIPDRTSSHAQCKKAIHKHAQWGRDRCFHRTCRSLNCIYKRKLSQARACCITNIFGQTNKQDNGRTCTKKNNEATMRTMRPFRTIGDRDDRGSGRWVCWNDTIV